jgi:hypothetical protein
VYAVPLVRPDTAIGDVADVPVTLPGFDVAVYPVIAALPIFDGAVKATLIVPPAAASVAVPIVGASGLVGQVPCTFKSFWSFNVHTPLATVAVGAGGFFIIKPPGYLALIYRSPVFVDGKERDVPGQIIRTAPTPPAPPVPGPWKLEPPPPPPYAPPAPPFLLLMQAPLAPPEPPVPL